MPTTSELTEMFPGSLQDVMEEEKEKHGVGYSATTMEVSANDLGF